MHMQLQVLQTDEENQGPFAFQLLSLAKLHLNPQVQHSYLFQKFWCIKSLHGASGKRFSWLGHVRPD